VICDETMTFTAWHTTDMDSAPKNHIETTHKVFFLKNAYRILSQVDIPIYAPDYQYRSGIPDVD